MKSILKTTLVTLAVYGMGFGQDAAVSSYLDPQTSGNADVRIREIRVPSSGHTINTYWCTLGYWSTGTSTGYGGIQYTNDNSVGPKNYIYSQWNDYTENAYNDPNTQVMTFGGEGTGVKSINNDPLNQWKPDYWHVTADRVWDEGNQTHFAYSVRNGETGIWKHIMTWSTPERSIRITGSYCFMEDWWGRGEYREGHIRKGWNRSSSTEQWKAITTYLYNINGNDIVPGGRSYNKRTNWCGGKREDATGEYFYMGAGGDVASTNNDGTRYSMTRTETSPQDEYGAVKISDLRATVIDNSSKLVVEWKNDNTTVPQFAYYLSVTDAGSEVLTVSDTIPEKRSDTLDISSLSADNKSYTVTLNLLDMFDGEAKSKSITFGNGIVTKYLTLLSPNGGETVMVGEQLPLTWETNLTTDSVDITLIEEGAEVLSVIREDATKGAYNWTVPKDLTEGAEYQLAITSVTKSDVSDTSDATFTITVPDSNYLLLDQSLLSVHSFDSEQAGAENAATNVLDGNSETIWHTDWAETAMPPHEIVLKANAEYRFSGLRYLPRQNGANGRIGEYKILVSRDGFSWGTAVSSGTFLSEASEKELRFEPTTGMYIKLVATSELQGQSWTSVAELNVLHTTKGDDVALNGTIPALSSEAVFRGLNGRELHLNLSQGVTYQVSMVKHNGRVVSQQKTQGNGLTKIALKSDLSNGIYILKITGGVQNIFTPLLLR